MTGGKGRWALLLVGLVVLVGLALVGHWARRPSGPVCALDGAPLVPDYQVEIVDAHGTTRSFCCVRCAEIWLRREQGRPQAITVTDEASGEPIDAAQAWYVRSSVMTTPATRNCIHVFRSRADAEKHADAFAGAVLSESERPFRGE